jgi:DeoR/GlpR family transcriptional regulator of sugar metabolism
MTLAVFLGDIGIDTVCLGGSIVEPPYMLGGNDTVETVRRYRADKCFFSTRAITSDGEMSYTDDIYFSMHREMMRNSERVIYLVDADKIDKKGGRVVLGDLSLVDTVISDYDFSYETKKKFGSVEFITIGIL